jgi:colanic acid/amylovoran biosynthesis glycosyltransferase
MKPVVAHCTRKSTQLRLAFIFNQVLYHSKYRPVIVFASDPGNDDSGFAEFDLNKYPHICSGEGRNFFRRLIFHYAKQISKKESREIIQYVKDKEVKCLHFHFGTDASIYWRVMRSSGIPSVVSFYGYDCSSFPSKYFGLGRLMLKHRVFKYATCVLAMSGNMKTDLLALGCPEEKILVHYHGIDVQKFNTDNRIRKTSDRITILTAGRLDEKKGHLFLLRALKQLLDETPYNIEWIIAGNGKQHGRISHEIARRNLEGIVKMTGSYAYNSGKLKELFDLADIYIQPSVTAKNGDKEGIPGTLVEAMAAGLPVISTNHAGIPSVLKDGTNGMLVNENDTAGLKKAIRQLADDPGLRIRLGKEARKFAVENLDVRRKEEELEKIYTDIALP